MIGNIIIRYNKVLKPGDSLFIEPYVKFCLYSNSKDGLIYLVTSEISRVLKHKKKFHRLESLVELLMIKTNGFLEVKMNKKKSLCLWHVI